MPTIEAGNALVMSSLFPTDSFYLKQSSATALPGEPPPPLPYQAYCTQTDMAAWRDLVYKHEGATQTVASSHYNEGLKFLQSAPVKVEVYFEALVYRSNAPMSLDSTINRRWDSDFRNPWQNASTDSVLGGPVKPVPALQCKLRKWP